MTLTEVRSVVSFGETITVYRCVLCNYDFITTHEQDDCDCETEHCPNADCPSNTEAE